MELITCELQILEERNIHNEMSRALGLVNRREILYTNNSDPTTFDYSIRRKT